MSLDLKSGVADCSYVTEDGLENEVGVSDSDSDDNDNIYENHTHVDPDPDKSIYDDLCSIRQYRSEPQVETTRAWLLHGKHGRWFKVRIVGAW